MASFLHNASIISSATAFETVIAYEEDDLTGRLLTGAEAATHVAYAFSDVLLDQPYSRRETSGNFGASSAEFVKDERKNIHGRVASVEHLGRNEANGSSLLKVPSDESATVVTGSPFLREMLPTMFDLSSKNSSCVFHVASLSEDFESGVTRSDLSDLSIVKETGFAILSSSTVQEAHDMAIVAHLVASKTGKPIIHSIDGGRIAGQISRTKLLGYNTLAKLEEEAGISHEANTVEVVQDTMESLADYFSHKYSPFEYFGPADADSVIVTTGVVSAVFQEVLSGHKNSKVGLIKVRVIRPFCIKKFLESLPTSVRRVCVVDQSLDSSKKLLFQDVVAAFHSDAQVSAPALVQANLSGHLTPGGALGIVKTLESSSNVKANIVVDNDAVYDSASELISKVVMWSMRNSTSFDFHVCAQILGPKLSLHVQQFDQFDSGNMSYLRSELRFAPIAITSEYPVSDAECVICDNASCLMLPQYNVLGQIADEGTLVVNESWNLRDMENVLGDKVKHSIASKKVKVYVIDASKIAAQAGVSAAASSWILQACVLFLSGKSNSSMSYPQALPHLQRLLRKEFRNQQAAKLLLSQISATSLESNLKVINYPESWSTLSSVVGGESVSALMQPLALEKAPEGPENTSSRNSYNELLEQVFSERLVVSDTNTSGPSAASSSLEGYYGEFLAKVQTRKRVVSHIGHMLKTSSDVNTELIKLLKQWYHAHDSVSVCNATVPRIKSLLKLEKGKNADLGYVFEHQEFLQKNSHWIVGSDNWAYDLSSSGIHHILASGDNVNVLVLDTQQYSKDSIKPGKKDIGLYAMSYGSAYVASISLLASHSQALRALSEADSFNGPSIVIAHAPRVDSTEPASPVAFRPNETSIISDFDDEVIIKTPAEEANLCVELGRWPLYRWNPALEEACKDPFVLDSSKLKQEVEEFLKREQQLTLLANKEMKLPEELHQSLESSLAAQHKALEEQARQRKLLAEQFDSLANGVSNPDLNLLVLYGSDGGNAAGLAELIAKKAEASKCGEVRVMEANEFNLDELSEEKHVFLILSTAGQGEDCANAKHFTENLHGSKSKLPGLKFAVFGLGDSHYWGEGTADSAKYFCKPAKDAHAKLIELGATAIVDVGLGDDQNDDGYEGTFSEWEPEVWKNLDVTPVQGKIAGGAPEIIDDEIKGGSNFLRGMIDEGLRDLSTGKLLPEDTKLTKFHGIYQQDLRSVREELDAAGLERAYSFMIRIGVPGGVATSEQYIAMDDLCSTYANGALKLTTRQAYQLHGVVKKNLKTTMQGINKACMDTLAACGDVNRNVIGNPHIRKSKVHAEVNRLSNALNTHLKPRTSAYHEIWLDKKRVGGGTDYEPIYGQTYLPRKFKIAIAVPPRNDVDVFAHCLGFIAIVDSRGNLEGWNVTIGGGMGTTHGNKLTYPRLSDMLGFCTTEQAVKVSEAIVILQRDNGHRTNRKHARLKYTVEDNGVQFFRDNVEKMCGFKLGDARPFQFTTNSDPYGWNKGIDGKWDYTMFVENGYIKDIDGYKIKTALREIAEFHVGGEFSLTANQNIIIGGVSDERKPMIQKLFEKYNIDNSRYSAMRLHSMACVALPTCALAMAESQTYLPSLVGKLEETLDEVGLRHDAITIRMTGCPNGCARPYVAEIAFVGKAPGNYNLYLGAGHAGNRINKMYKEGVNEEQILAILRPLLRRYASERNNGEKFGDWVIRAGVIEPTLQGKYFWSTGEENKLESPSGTYQIYW